MAVPKGRPWNQPAPPLTRGRAIPEAPATPRRRSTPKTPSQPRPRRTKPGPPQGAAPRMSAGIRRNLSQWELDGDDDVPEDSTRLILPTQARARRLLSSSGPRQSTQEPLFQAVQDEAQDGAQEEVQEEAPAPQPRKRGRPPKNKMTAVPESAPVKASAPQPKKRGRPPKNKTTAAPEPKRQRATPKEGPPAAVVGVGIASPAQATVGEGSQTTRSGRQVRLTKKATEAQ